MLHPQILLRYLLYRSILKVLMFFIRRNRWKIKSDQNWSKGQITYSVIPKQVSALIFCALIEQRINAFTCQTVFLGGTWSSTFLLCNWRVHAFIIASMQQPRGDILFMLWYTLPDLSCVKHTQRESTEAPMNEPEETSHITTLHIKSLIEQHQVKVIHVQIFCTYF